MWLGAPYPPCDPGPMVPPLGDAGVLHRAVQWPRTKVKPRLSSVFSCMSLEKRRPSSCPAPEMRGLLTPDDRVHPVERGVRLGAVGALVRAPAFLAREGGS